MSRLRSRAKAILQREFGVEVGRTRFKTADGYSWPIVIVAIDDAIRLGYFDPRDCTLGIHKRLMYTAKNRVIDDILRHELAHYFSHIEYPEQDAETRPHGVEFKGICDKYDLPFEARQASVDVCAENEAFEGELANEAVLAKFKRLMSLSESDNEHEAALAVLRANELMVRHNLDGIDPSRGDENEVEYCVRRVLDYKRSSPRTSAVAEILGEFLVYPVHTGEGLEVTGTRANVEQAEYIAAHLNRALAAAWKTARSARPDRPLRQKPFMAAAAAAYVEKLRRSRSRLPKDDQRALVVLEGELEWASRGAYGGALQLSRTAYRNCAASSAQGARAGAEIEIRRGVGASGTTALLRG